MKKLCVLFMVFVLLMTSGIFSASSLGEADEKENFVIVSIPHKIDYNSRETIKARYVDTKEPITLSQNFDDLLCAIVPSENKDREIEAFSAKEIEFTDYDPSKYGFSYFKNLSKTGVIKGNDKGEALPFSDVTRAEAVAMLMRLLGLSGVAKDKELKQFSDVKKESWYYDAVMSAVYCNITEGDSEDTFSPDRNVTREEMTVLAYRAIKYAGLGYPGVENLNAKDIDKISPWAKEAYQAFGNYAPTDYDDTDPENPVRVIYPQKNASRFNVAQIMFDLSERCAVYPKKVAYEFGFDKEMPVIDGSTSTYPFTDAVYQSLFYNGGNHPERPKTHSKSHQSYEKLISGEIDMMFASVYPASDILELAKAKGVEIELIPIAYDAMIFFTNMDNPAKGLTSSQIADIYVNNAYSNWKDLGGSDALLYPYCRNNDSGSHAQMEKHFLKGNEIHEKIRNETTSVTMANVLTDVMNAKTESPLGYGLGYSIYYYFNNMDLFYNTKSELKLLEIDGVYPDDKTIADGTYPLANHTYIAIRKDTPKDSPARKMAEFMLTEAGQECVQMAGFGRLYPKQSEDNK